MIVVFLTLISVVLWILSQAQIDAEHQRKEQYITDHTSRFQSRALVVILVGLLKWNVGIGAWLMFWALFDAARNIMLKQDVFYIGEIANTDNFFKDKKGLYVASKITALLLGFLFLTF